jgi:D-glycero-D-manno-heptose 1,7-bisphosphate phosphatase
MVYYPDHGIVDSPFNVDQFELLPEVAQAISSFKDMGFKVIVVSNQPGIAKGHMKRDTFENIRHRMQSALATNGAELDGEYYCFHHPDAVEHEWRTDCSCRKPNDGLLLKAAAEKNIDLASSWMIGDGLTDIQAGKSAGCRTILIGKMKCELCGMIDDDDARPDGVCGGLPGAVEFINSFNEIAHLNEKISEESRVK